jgi:small subunit ribosomal protein S19e
LPTPYDVPASTFIKKLAQYLKDNIDEVKPPPWAAFAKTGAHAERPPQNADWWYIRCASLLRKTYMKGPIGIEHLRSEYGGRKDRGAKPEHTRKGGGSSIRKALQQLEAAGLIETVKGEGRIVSREGRRLLDTLATEILAEMKKKTSN